MSQKQKEKKSESVSIRLRESTFRVLNKLVHDEDRSIGYIIERSVRKDLGLDK